MTIFCFFSIKCQTATLFSFSSGVITTVELPSLRTETHRTQFKGHRCGSSGGKLYLLPESRTHYAYDTEALGEAGVLKVYDLRTKQVEKTVNACACNAGNTSLMVKGSEIIDIGWYPRTISVSNGNRKNIVTIGDCTKISQSAACLVLNKTIYLFASCSDEEINTALVSDDMCPSADLTPDCGLFCLPTASWKPTKLLPRLTPHLSDLSLLPLSPTELLLLGWNPASAETMAYRFFVGGKGGRLQREGGCRAKLGVCQSFCVLSGVLYLFFQSNCLARCHLATGLMRVINFPSYSKRVAVLFTVVHTKWKRLPPALVAEVLAISGLTPQ